jgi:hypothetical protein
MKSKYEELLAEIESSSRLLESSRDGKTLIYISNTPSSIKPLYDAIILFHKKRISRQK